MGLDAETEETTRLVRQQLTAEVLRSPELRALIRDAVDSARRPSGSCAPSADEAPESVRNQRRGSGGGAADGARDGSPSAEESSSSELQEAVSRLALEMEAMQLYQADKLETLQRALETLQVDRRACCAF